MASTFAGLDIGKTGLYAYQAALDTTAHNVSNAETDGYSRQQVEQSANKALRVSPNYGMQGTGVNVNGINQIRNEYYDVKYRDVSQLSGKYTTASYYMTELESYFNEIQLEGFTTSFDNFFETLQELSKNPSSSTVRTEVTNYAVSLSKYINELSYNLTSIQEEANFDIKTACDRINSLAEQIAGLNRQINTLEVNEGIKANDLRDARNQLVDELSQFGSVTVKEVSVSREVGINRYMVYFDNKPLVETYDYNGLVCIPKKDKINLNDADGLYDIYWTNGQRFHVESNTLGGVLQSLIEIRDGNNKDNLSGTAIGSAGDTEVVLTDTNINNMNRLNLPESGLITIASKEYSYNGYQVNVNDEGQYEYTFYLTSELATDSEISKGVVGRSVDYKGIPYYQAQLNEFVRVFSKKFNDLHKQGVDLNGNFGMDFFNGTDSVTGENFTFIDFDTQIEQEEEYEFSYKDHTYNRINAANFSLTKAIELDVSLIACSDPDVSEEETEESEEDLESGGINNGVENQKIIQLLMALKEDITMFKQGKPEAFLHTIITEIGVDTNKAKNFQENEEYILKSVENQRLSVMGVDIDEEAMNLVKYQNAYNLNCKVITVMDQIYDKLINYMGA